HFVVEDAHLYTRAETPPLIVGAAITPETAEWVGGWADAMITVSHAPDKIRQMIDSFRAGGGEGKPLFLQAQVSYAATHEEAMRAARVEWGSNIFASRVLSDLRMPADFEALRGNVTDEALARSIHISA